MSIENAQYKIIIEFLFMAIIDRLTSVIFDDTDDEAKAIIYLVSVIWGRCFLRLKLLETNSRLCQGLRRA